MAVDSYKFSPPTVPNLVYYLLQTVCKIPVSYYVSGHRGHRRCLCDSPAYLEDLTHLALSGLVDSSNEVWRKGTDLVSVARELGLYWGHTFTSRSGRLHIVYAPG